jgi:hypothetical protein
MALRPCSKGTPVDAAPPDPPRVVFDAAGVCTDGDRAGDALRSELASARAPTAGWSVTARVEREGPSRLRARGDIADATGATIAHRELEGTSECAGLARAMGVWASLVLDAEVQRAQAAPGESVPSMGAGPPGSAIPTVISGWPAPAAPDPPSPEHDWYLHHEEGRTLELGAGVFLMSGTGGGALAGPVAFVVIEAGHGVFLRPSLAFGQAITSLPPSDVKSAMWGAGRFDACLRVPGLYARRHGMQLDMCGGADGGMTHIDASGGSDLPFLAFGPSLDLRGELGGRFSAVLRLVAGIEVIRSSFIDLSGTAEQQPLGSGRLELAFSWDAQ